MSSDTDIRVGDLIEVRYGDTETRIIGRVKAFSHEGTTARLDGDYLVTVRTPDRTVTVLERPEPSMEPLPTEFGAHIVATVDGTERELIRDPAGHWINHNGFFYRSDQITAWRWAKNPRPLPSVEDLAGVIWTTSRADESTISGIGAEHVSRAILDHLRERGYGS